MRKTVQLKGDSLKKFYKVLCWLISLLGLSTISLVHFTPQYCVSHPISSQAMVRSPESGPHIRRKQFCCHHTRREKRVEDMSPYFKVLHPNHGESRVLCPDHPPPTTHPPLSTRLQCLLSGDPTSIPDHPPPILHSPLRPALGLSVRSLGPGIPKPEDRRTLLSPQPGTTNRDPCVAPCVVNQCLPRFHRGCHVCGCGG